MPYRKAGLAALIAFGVTGAAYGQTSEIEPRAYLEAALSQLREQHVNRAAIDWVALEAELQREIADARTAADTYPAIRRAIELLGEKHTSLQVPSGRPEVRALGPALAYVRVPQFSGSREAGASYAATLRRGIAELDAQGACGWIVDLRYNGGGNVWPMFDGVAALLGDGHILTFDIAARGPERVLMKNGVAYQEGGAPPYELDDHRPLRSPEAPVALLIDKGTGSSAEALTVAFSGRPNVRRFGEATANYNTVNNPIRLADGAIIYMTVGWNVDRNGRRYEGAIEPDQMISGSDRDWLDAAQRWLAGQDACRGRMTASND